MTDELEFARAGLRIERFLISAALAGTALAAVAAGWKWAAGFLAGSAIAWVNLRWLMRLVRKLGGQAAPSSFSLALRFFLLGGSAYAILRFSPIPAVSVIAGIFVLIAAVFVEIVFELVYARKRTLDHQDL